MGSDIRNFVLMTFRFNQDINMGKVESDDLEIHPAQSMLATVRSSTAPVSGGKRGQTREEWGHLTPFHSYIIELNIFSIESYS